MRSYLVIILVECPLSTFLVVHSMWKSCTQKPKEDYVEAAINQVLEIHMTYPPGDVVVHMGQEDIETTCEVLADRCNQLAEKDPQVCIGMKKLILS